MVVTNAVSIKFLVSRIHNQLQCWWSYALSLLGIVRVRHLPTFVSIEPANICQLHCPECPVGRHEHIHSNKHYLSFELFKKILLQVSPTAHTIQFYFQGEPLLNEHLPKMVYQAHQEGIYTIISTNAQALNKEMAAALVRSGLNRIIVSIDGFSQETYASYRVGGDLQKALDGLRFLHEARKAYRKSLRIELQVLRLKSNEHEWKWIQKNYKKLGATHLIFKTAQLDDYEHGHPLMPTDERHSRYKKMANGKYQLRHPHIASDSFCIVTPCLRLWSGCVISTNGEVLPCCYDKAHAHALGNINTESLHEIFHSKQANTIRQDVLFGKVSPLPEMCRNCDH